MRPDAAPGFFDADNADIASSLVRAMRGTTDRMRQRMMTRATWKKHIVAQWMQAEGCDVGDAVMRALDMDTDFSIIAARPRR